MNEEKKLVDRKKSIGWKGKGERFLGVELKFLIRILLERTC